MNQKTTQIYRGWPQMPQREIENRIASAKQQMPFMDKRAKKAWREYVRDCKAALIRLSTQQG